MDFIGAKDDGDGEAIIRDVGELQIGKIFIYSYFDGIGGIYTGNSSRTTAVMGGRRRTSICAGCRDEILDQYILRVSPDLEWHVGCLRCSHCHQALDETCTCFVREQLPYCKRDYVR